MLSITDGLNSSLWNNFHEVAKKSNYYGHSNLEIGMHFKQVNQALAITCVNHSNSGSSGRLRGGGEKHEICVTTFGGHLFYSLFSQGGHDPLDPPGSATAQSGSHSVNIPKIMFHK